MKNLSNIALDINQSKVLIENLNQLLANYQIFYMNVRGFHWNIKGEKFFELHLKFEELYNNIILKIDEIAERILTLGGVPLHSYSDYIKMSTINEMTNCTTSKDTVHSVLESMKRLILMQRELLSLADEANDEGTNALMSDYIREQEKLVWMYSSFINN